MQSFGIEVVGVVVATSDEVYNSQGPQQRRVHDALGNAHMGLVSARIFARQRIGKVGIENECSPAIHEEKAALAQPP